MGDTQRQTRSRSSASASASRQTQRQTRSKAQSKARDTAASKKRSGSQTELKDHFGFTTTSTVPLPGVGTSRSKRARTNKVVKPIERETAKLKKEVKKTKAAKDKVTEKADKADSDAKTDKEKADEAERELLALSAENTPLIAELKSNATSAKGAKPNKEGDHPACAKAFEALRRDGTNVLSYQDPATLGGAKITKRDLTEKQLREINAALNQKNYEGKYAGYTAEDQHLINAQKYKDHAEQGGIGLAGYNAEKDKNIEERIPEACAKFGKFLYMHEDGKGFDFKPIEDGRDPSRVRDLIAVYCHMKNFRYFQQQITNRTGKLGGMHSFRILENGEIVKGRIPRACANAGYRFRFNKDNKMRFQLKL